MLLNLLVAFSSQCPRTDSLSSLFQSRGLSCNCSFSRLVIFLVRWRSMTDLKSARHVPGRWQSSLRFLSVQCHSLLGPRLLLEADSDELSKDWTDSSCMVLKRVFLGQAPLFRGLLRIIIAKLPPWNLKVVQMDVIIVIQPPTPARYQLPVILPH